MGAVADPGERTGGPGPSPYFLDQTEDRRAEKNIFSDRLPALSQGLDDRPAPPPSEGLGPPLGCTLNHCFRSKNNKMKWLGISLVFV